VPDVRHEARISAGHDHGSWIVDALSKKRRVEVLGPRGAERPLRLT